MTSTRIEATTPSARPSPIAAGALQTRHDGPEGGSGSGRGSISGVVGGTLAVIQSQG